MPRKYNRKPVPEVSDTGPVPTVTDYAKLVREHGELQKQHDQLFEEHIELKEQYHELVTKNVPQLLKDLTTALTSASGNLNVLNTMVERVTGYDRGYQAGEKEGFSKGIHRIVAAAEAKMCEEFKCAPAALGSKKPAWWIAALMVTNPAIPDPESKKPRKEGVKMSSLARGQRQYED